MNSINLINLIIIILASASAGWYWKQNTILQRIREKLHMEKYDCEYCTATIIAFIFLLPTKTIIIIMLAPLAGFIAYHMVKSSNTF